MAVADIRWFSGGLLAIGTKTIKKNADGSYTAPEAP